MKILSILYSPLQNSPIKKMQVQNPQVSMQYAYNLPFDTISFEGRRKNKVQAEEDGWLDERDMNSDVMLKYIQDNSFEQVVNFMEGLEENDWEPNYCLFDKDGDDHCLMGLVLEKMADCPQGSEEYQNLRKIAGCIAAHKDFLYINDSIGEDNLYTALATYNPEIAVDIIYSKNFQENLNKIDLDKYIPIAYEQNMKEVLEILKNNKPEAKEPTGGGGGFLLSG